MHMISLYTSVPVLSVDMDLNFTNQTSKSVAFMTDKSCDRLFLCDVSMELHSL